MHFAVLPKPIKQCVLLDSSACQVDIGEMGLQTVITVSPSHLYKAWHPTKSFIWVLSAKYYFLPLDFCCFAQANKAVRLARLIGMPSGYW
jgi:hypothetical protein